jgi:hypothetical protein
MARVAYAITSGQGCNSRSCGPEPARKTAHRVDMVRDCEKIVYVCMTRTEGLDDRFEPIAISNDLHQMVPEFLVAARGEERCANPGLEDREGLLVASIITTVALVHTIISYS